MLDRDTLWIDVFMDGDKWCCLLGENLQEGRAGFGDSPIEALEDLCAALRQEPYLIVLYTV